MEKHPTRPHTLSAEATRRLKGTSTATLTTQLLKRGLRNTFLGGLQVLRPDLRMVGYAFTLRYAPAREDRGSAVHYDNSTDVQRLAVEAIGPDEVLVIDARGETRSASLGHILATRITRRGAAGIVTDGALRDLGGFSELPISTYVRAAHATTSSVIHHPVDMNVPIGCAGVLVMPGDVLVGDSEGVVVIPAAMAEEVAHDAYEQEVLEEFILAKVDAGGDIHGLYPPNEATLAEFEQWRRDRPATRV
ncbi:ribonuclease activity regulator RraA [Pseudonocardia sp. MH-G8]|uniref:ribonuclease activity regulator RraA n=1 Tax=Pseudonocardia sp. MH-G8 TaxID=1854588 RepID=UPI000B9FA90E|nr:ribonuclease activity regulator RraA [Pseudonocardia sp. MH-G8]OZM75772.1 ribonuclease activity regulator RraA [Pseudonocardia sp. MH-G8]